MYVVDRAVGWLGLCGCASEAGPWKAGTPYLLGSRLLPKQSGGKKQNLTEDAIGKTVKIWLRFETYAY